MGKPWEIAGINRYKSWKIPSHVGLLDHKLSAMPPFPSQMFQSESTNSSVAVFHLLLLPSRHRPSSSSIPRANVAMFEKGRACEPTQWTPSGTKQNHETSQWAKNTAESRHHGDSSVRVGKIRRTVQFSAIRLVATKHKSWEIPGKPMFVVGYGLLMKWFSEDDPAILFACVL